MDTRRRKLNLAIAAMLVTGPVSAEGMERLRLAMPWRNTRAIDLSFSAAFPKPLHRKTYFGVLVTAGAIVGAGLFSYFTAGAGAPVAATGVSTLASWLAGGGAGSYMAGLSMVGGWLGGNAMLGSAILNGISIGVLGGGGAFATMSTVSKIAVATSFSASMLDGVLLFKKPDTNRLQLEVALDHPAALASKDVKKLIGDYQEANTKLRDAQFAVLTQVEPVASEGNGAQLPEDDVNVEVLQLRRKRLVEEGMIRLRALLRSDDADSGDLVALGVLARSEGDYDLFEQVIAKIDSREFAKAGYVNYLRAISSLDMGNLEATERYARRSMAEDPYAIEPALLLVNLLGHLDFAAHKSEILEIANRYAGSFDANAYDSQFSMVSLFYRIGSQFLAEEDFDRALDFFKRADESFGVVQKLMGRWSRADETLRFVRVSQANALYLQGNQADANELFDRLVSAARDEREKETLRASYVGEFNREGSAD